MNILKIFRKSSFILISAIGFLVFSCTQYDLSSKRSFSYALYKMFKEQNLKLVEIDFNNQGRITFQEIKDLLEALNNEYGSNLSIPDNILDAMYNLTDYEDIKSFILNENLLNENDFINLEGFTESIGLDDFEVAIDEFEQEIISQSLSEEKFIEYDYLASSLKITYDEDPELFDNPNEVARGIGGCLIAYVVWLAALVGFVAGCGGPQAILFCVSAVIGLASATYAAATACAGIM